MSTKVRSVFGTLNNYVGPTEDFLIKEGYNIKCAIWQLEEGKEGTRHIQFYIQFNNPISFTKLKDTYKGAHFEKPRSHKACWAYCGKEETRIEGPYKYGVFENQGERSDLRSAMDSVKKGMKRKQLREEHPEVMAKYARFMHEYSASIHSDRATKLVKEDIDHDWQREIAKKFEEVPDRRTVHWIYSYDGNKGKSKMAAWLADNMEALVVDITQKKDIYYIYDFEKIVVINVPRHFDMAMFNYGILEQFKDGRITSTKYEPVVKKFDPPHVIVFANVPPDTDKMSADRWNIKEI